MATNLCVSNQRRNTGQERCDILMKAIAYPLVTNYEFTAADLASEAALFARINLNAQLPVTHADKIFVFPKTNGADPTTEAPSVETLADGTKQRSFTPAPSYNLIYASKAGQAQALYAFNGYSGKMYWVDLDGKLYYRPKADGGGRGFSVSELYSDAPAPPGYTGANVRNTALAFANVDEFLSFTATSLSGDYSIANVQQVVDVDLYSADAAVGYVITVGGRLVFTKEEIFDSYGDALNDPDMWIVTRLDTGVVVTVTGTAKDAAKKGWDLTLSNSPTIGSGVLLKVELNLTNMHLDDIRGIESRPVSIPKA